MKYVGIFLGDSPFKTDKGIVNLQPYQGSHWVLYIREGYIDFYVCAPPQKLSKIIVKRNGHCLYSEYKIQGLTSKRDCYCASYCLYINYLSKVIEIDVKSAVLNLYYQMI